MSKEELHLILIGAAIGVVVNILYDIFFGGEQK